MTKAFSRNIIYGLLFIFAFSYSSANAQTWAAVKRADKWFYIDKSGNIVVHKLFEAAGDRFTDGLAPVKLEGKWGYINTAGKMVIANKLSVANTFYQGHALVQKNNRWQIINTKGKTIQTLNIIIENLDTITEGIALITAADKSRAYIFPSGKILAMDKSYQDVQPFSNGMARVKKSGNFGYIDTSGTLKISCTFDAASPFKDNIACVQSQGFYKLINKKGEIQEELPYLDDVATFVGNMAVVPMQGEYKIYKRGNKNPVATDLTYNQLHIATYVYPFSEYIARFWSQTRVEGFRFGYVLPDGKLLNPYYYEWANDFHEGLAAVKLNGIWGYINPRGEMVLDAIYEEAHDFYPVK
jgi:hypothetical protein